ncbi:MAG TPA: hypothetical protein VNW92_04940, partial [Polyangiaceae bacterium]|nr:hypothetical protein [Polyangiaceae bacterium]
MPRESRTSRAPRSESREAERPLELTLEERIVSELQAGQRSKAQLKKSVAKRGSATPSAAFDAALAHLLSEARIFAHYKPLQNGLPGKTLAGYALVPPTPPPLSAWAANVVAVFEEIAEQAAIYGVTREALFAETLHGAKLNVESVLLAVLGHEQLDARAPLQSIMRGLGGSVGRASQRAAPRHSTPPVAVGVPAPRPSARPRPRHSIPPASRKTDTEVVLHALSDLSAAAPGEHAVAIALLRRATQLEKRRFDRAVLALASFGSVELLPQPPSEQLTEQEQSDGLLE